ncbi:MAG: phenylacetate-CoA oxygenase subunit PaaC [Actinobacteria bacterium]|nr:phenylacetate-CoA oxygenase subunit PaaC [Actinomycetota bacterium]
MADATDTAPDAAAPATDVLDELGIALDDPRTAFLLAIGDDELVSGHRASHWTGVAPSLEEDIAFSGIAQDEINHADVWYQMVVGGLGAPGRARSTGDGLGDERAAVDRLGLGRAPDEYRHAVLCERPPRDFAYTLARHLLYDHADAVRLAALTGSSDPEIAAVSRKLAHEERYHLEHADTWFWRCARGGDDARSRIEAGLRRAFPEALWLFEPTPGEDELVDGGLLPSPSTRLLVEWLDEVGAKLTEAGLADVMDPVTAAGDGWDVPDDLFAEPGGRRGVHTEDFTHDVWPEMTRLYREHPGASW